MAKVPYRSVTHVWQEIKAVATGATSTPQLRGPALANEGEAPRGFG